MSRTPRPRWLSALMKLALLVASLLLVALTAEVALRLAPTGAGPKVRRPKPSDHADLPKLHSVFELAQPNQRGIFKGLLYTTNSWGIRGPEIALQKPPGTLRIAVIGDSVTMGSGVLEAEAYPARLEQRLRASLQARPVEVLNLGIGGLDLVASLRRLEAIGLQFEPDLVVYGWTINDLEGEGYRMQRRTKPFEGLASSRLALGRWLAERLRATVPIVHPLEGSYLAELDDNYFGNPEVWRRFENGLDRLARITDTRGSCGVVFLHPVLATLGILHPFDRFYEAVSTAARVRGFYVISSVDRFRGLDERQLWVNRFDPHPNAEAHGILAESLYSGLVSLPARCWPPEFAAALRE